MSTPRGPRCWSCGYPIAGLATEGPCPECGTQISSAAIAHARAQQFRPSHLRVLGWLSIVMVIALNWIGMIFAAYVFREASAGMRLVRSGDIRDAGARQIRAAYWTSMLALLGGAFVTVVLVALVIIATSID